MKIPIALSVLLMIIIIGVVAFSAYTSSESYRAKKAAEPTVSMEVEVDYQILVC